jgi:hypothetical protein
VNFSGDLVAHEGVEVLERVARDRLEVAVPPRLTLAQALGRQGSQPVDLLQVPAGGKKTFHHRAA